MHLFSGNVVVAIEFNQKILFCIGSYRIHKLNLRFSQNNIFDIQIN